MRGRSTSSAITPRRKRKRRNSSPVRRKRPRPSSSKNCGTKRGSYDAPHSARTENLSFRAKRGISLQLSSWRPVPQGGLAMKILLITEQRDAKWNKVSFETLAAAQQIAGQAKATLSGAVVGKGVAALADELAGYQLDEVLLVEHELLAQYTPDGFSIALRQVIESAKPDLVLLPHTYQVRDFAPKLAASMQKGMIGDCIGYRHENGRLIFVRQMFQGRTAADVVFIGEPPWIASFQAGSFRADLAAKHN